jgi:hypothetical protein
VSLGGKLKDEIGYFAKLELKFSAASPLFLKEALAGNSLDYPTAECFVRHAGARVEYRTVVV